MAAIDELERRVSAGEVYTRAGADVTASPPARPLAGSG